MSDGARLELREVLVNLLPLTDGVAFREAAMVPAAGPMWPSSKSTESL